VGACVDGLQRLIKSRYKVRMTLLVFFGASHVTLSLKMSQADPKRMPKRMPSKSEAQVAPSRHDGRSSGDQFEYPLKLARRTCKLFVIPTNGAMSTAYLLLLPEQQEASDTRASPTLPYSSSIVRDPTSRPL
jgi:hypothetical protein